MKTIEELKREAEELEARVAAKRAADEEAKNPERLALEKRIADAKRELGEDRAREALEELRRGCRPPFSTPQHGPRTNPSLSAVSHGPGIRALTLATHFRIRMKFGVTWVPTSNNAT